jgi:hypothetical protein
MERISAQQRLLGLVQDQIPDKYSLVFELSELLGVSTDSIYRRIRGETLLDINEIQKICLHYNISFDSICGCEQTGMVSFLYHPVVEISDYLKWTETITSNLKSLVHKKDAQIIYAAIDIPIFHNFNFPLVSFFKTLYWLKSVTNHPDYQQVKFSLDNIKPEFIKVGKSMHDLYCLIPSTEIWTDLITYSLLRQIDYYWDSGEFATKGDALALCDEVEREFDYLKNAAASSSKILERKRIPGEPVNFQLYDCDIEIATNCVMTINGDQKTVYLSTQTFNIVMTSNVMFANETHRWLNTLIKKSTLISDVGEKQRSLFFREAYDKITQLKHKIRNDI